MINTFLEDNAWFYWVITAGALLFFVGYLLACICSCRRHENKSEFLGLAGMVTITNHAECDEFDRPPTTDISQIVAQDAVDGGKRVSGANRSLPDIPKDKNVGRDGEVESAPQEVIYEATEIIGDPSELYATVQDKSVDKKRDFERETRSKDQDNSSILDDSAYPYARLNTLESNNDEHPYAQVQNIQKAEYSQQNRNNVSQFTDSNQPSTSTSHASGVGNPVAPPRTRRSSSHNSLLSVETTCEIQAANAITGGVQANQDLPYMTPPILLPLPRPPQAQQQNVPHQHFSGDSQDSKGYTSISVREPLANIIAQTKGLHQNRQGSRSLTDPHYATVSDDSDEMYAAIDEQDKVYTSGSETYAQIQPMMNEVRTVQVEQQIQSQVPSRSCVEDSSVPPAPQPPSVDSLRHVAHAHSRQASSSSATSSVANPGSPKPEKRQANSPLPPPPPPPPGPGEAGVDEDFYALVDKRGNKSEENRARSSGASCGKSLEDMYAKVMKKKRDIEDNIFDVAAPSSNPAEGSGAQEASSNRRKLSLVEISRASWSSHDSVEIQKREPEGTNAQNSVDAFNAEMDMEFSKIAKTYELDLSSDRLLDGTDDHDYEPLANNRGKPPQQPSRVTSGQQDDPNYEMLRPQYTSNVSTAKANVSNPRNGIDVLPIYSLPFKHRQVSNASSEDPGYERVRLRPHVDVDQDTDSEPNYESMPHEASEPNYASVCRPGDSDTDPNYESVTHGDPNYESVRYMSLARNTEPPYERVNDYNEQTDRGGHPVGYEKVKSNPIAIDPNYEKITLSHNETIAYNDSGDTDDEQYVQV